MGFGYLIVGFMFFFLPNFNIIDLFPDFVGCLFITKGLSKLADLTPGLFDACESFKKLTYIFLVKFVLMFTVPFFGNSDGGYILIFTFSFAVLDVIFTLPAFKTLLNGFTYLGGRTNASVLFKNQSEFSTLTSLFFITRALLALIPDLSYISNPDYSSTVTNDTGFYISNYRTLLTAINFLVVGVLGIVWFLYSYRYFTSIKKDKTLMKYLSEKYENEILTNKGIFIRRNIKTAYFLVVIGSVIMLDLLIDYINVIPDFIGALMFVISAYLINKHVKSKLYTVFSLIFLVCSGISWAVLCYYGVKYPAVNIWANFEAYDLFVWVNVLNAIKYASLVLFLFSLFKTNKLIIKQHTGTSVGELNSIVRTTEEKKKNMYKQNVICFILGFVCAVSGVIRMFFLYDLGFYSVVDFSLNFVWIFFLSKLLSNINSAIEYKYL